MHSYLGHASDHYLQIPDAHCHECAFHWLRLSASLHSYSNLTENAVSCIAPKFLHKLVAKNMTNGTGGAVKNMTGAGAAAGAINAFLKGAAAGAIGSAKSAIGGK